MAKKDYVIVSAPDTNILEMLVEGYIGDGLTPIGGVTIDPRGTNTVYMQAMYRMHKPQQEATPEDWTQEMTQIKL